MYRVWAHYGLLLPPSDWCRCTSSCEPSSRLLVSPYVHVRARVFSEQIQAPARAPPACWNALSPLGMLCRCQKLPGPSSVVEHTFFDAEYAARVNKVQEERVKLRGTVQLQARAQNARWRAQRASLSMGPSTFTVDPGDVKVLVTVV